jgi:hypothetical protein
VKSSKCGVCVCRLSPVGGVFIGPWESSIDLAEAVTHQVVAGRPSHETGQGIWLADHPLGPLVSGLYTLSPHVTYILRVALILVEFQISL